MKSNRTKTIPNGKDERGSVLYDWADALVYALIFIVLIFTLVVRITSVIGESMEPTLYNDDTLILSKLFYSPQYGDVIVISKKSFRPDPIVKRIVATEGQKVSINFDEGVVYVDDKALSETYTRGLTTRKGDMEFPVYVPEGFVFVLGDNRNHSVDSRYLEVGLVDERQIIGRVLFRLLPFSSFGKLKQ